MLIETVLQKYMEAKEKDNQMKNREGFYGGEYISNVFTMLLVYSVIFVYFIMIPLAIYFIFKCTRYNLQTWQKILLVLLLFTPYLGFILNIVIVVAGISACT